LNGRELRGVTGATITTAQHQTPYPNKSQKFNDEATNDSGGNFGRVARGGLMTGFIAELMALPLSGIPAKHCQAYLKIFADGAQAAAIDRGLANIKPEVVAAGVTDDKLASIDALLAAVKGIVTPE
jgi:hypothetical protein